MSEKSVEGVQVKETGKKKWDFDYRQSGMEAVYRRGDWQSWEDIENWLDRNGDADNEITPGEAIAMGEDLRSVEAAGEAFASNPEQAYRMAHKFRGENNQKYAAEHTREAQKS
jgi:hypothetical protein